MNEDEYNFIFGSGSITAFDRALATVTLRTDRNIPGESYPIYATATFGSQIVKLKAGATEFDVVFEIHEAEMLLNTVQTELEYGPEYHDQKKVLETPKDTEIIERAKSAKSGSVGRQKIELTAGSEVENQRKEKFQGISKQYEHADINHLKIGKRNSDHPLDGTVVRDYQGWVAHRSSLNTRSGVRAELNVRESWVKFRDPYSESKTIVGNLWKRISSSEVREFSEKKRLFADLLKILALQKLSSINDREVATLDLHAILCVPSQNLPGTQAAAFASARPIEVDDEQLLLDFLQTPDSLAPQFVANVRENRLTKLGKAFVPHCSVASAFDCWKIILKDVSKGKLYSFSSAIERFGRNEVKDLMAAGLLSHEDSSVLAIDHYPSLAPMASFKAYISRKSTIRLVNGLLMDNPNLKSVNIGEKVGVDLGKNWKASTCENNGRRLRAWTGFAYGETLVTSRNEPLARYLGSDLALKKGRGRPSTFSGENLKLVSSLKKQGVPKSEIAKRLGVKPSAIYNFISRHPDKWDNI